MSNNINNSNNSNNSDNSGSSIGSTFVQQSGHATSINSNRKNIQINPTSIKTSYGSDLYSNLKIDKVNNPSYICSQFQVKQCDYIKNPQMAQNCRNIWKEVCKTK